MSDIVLHGSLASRTFTPRWMLAELDLPYRLQVVDIRANDQKKPSYLELNPMGKVPTLTDDGIVVTETAAICLYLADRYGHGAFAPRIDDPDRGPYLRWLVFATAVLEPAILLRDAPQDPRQVGWGNYETALTALAAALTPGPHVLGQRFSAADVMLGAVVGFALYNKRIEARAPFVAYNDLLAARPAFQRAQSETWPPELMASLNKS